MASLVFPWLGPQGQPATGHPQVTHATVLVESLLVNATKRGGRCWDPGCDEKKSGEAAKAAASAASAAIIALTTATTVTVAPWAAAFTHLAPLAAKVWSHPDTAGWAYVIQGGRFSEPLELKVRKDTLTPQWGARFDNVPISENTALYLKLVDADPDIPFTNGHDDMGIFSVNAAHLVAAMKAGETHQVHVAEQTYDQVLFVGISVWPEGG